MGGRVGGFMEIWGIHGGRSGDANHQFLNGKMVALGWAEMGDLSQLPATRDAFKAAVQETYPTTKPGAVPVYGGLLYRFVHEIQLGDLVVYPSKVDRLVHIGRIDGPYAYDPNVTNTNPSDPFVNTRKVTWIKAVPRTSFTQGALYEMGSALSFFQIKNYADEIRALLTSGTPAIPAPDEDPTVAVVAEEIEQSTRDFVLKTLQTELKGHPLTHFVADVMRTMGYRSRIAPEGPDGGVDILASRDALGFEPPIIKVQVKSTDGTTGAPEVQALFGNVDTEEHGLFVALGGYTKQARDFAKSKRNLRLVDGNELVDLALEHYDDLDPGYRIVLPLRRVFVPAPSERE
jgi:restriction system protein